jgi:tetratricopeptide (TPR) repeat protein
VPYKKFALSLLTLAFFMPGLIQLGVVFPSYRAARTLAMNIPQARSGFPCSHPPLTVTEARQALTQAQPGLPSPILQAAAACALGDRSAAFEVYSRAAAAGDTWSSLQAFFLSGGQTIPVGLPQKLSSRELNAARSASVSADPSIDWRPLIRQVAERRPGDEAAWQAWLAEGRRLEDQAQWAEALAWYREGLDQQSILGTAVYRSSLALRAGWIFQSQADLRDYYQALAYYDEALNAERFTSDGERINLRIYRGQTYYQLRADVGPERALAEFKQALALDASNFSATLWTGIVYLNGFSDPNQALPWLQRAAALKSDNQTVYYYLGLAYTRLGQLEAAAKAYDRALEINPAWDAVRKLREALP